MRAAHQGAQVGAAAEAEVQEGIEGMILCYVVIFFARFTCFSAS